MQPGRAEDSMTSSDESAVDFEESFRALDTTFSGSISMDDVLTLFLGMGYQPETMTEEELRSRSGNKDHLGLSETKRLLRQFPRFRHETDQRAHMQSLFQAILPDGARTLGRGELMAIFKNEGGIDLADDKADAILQFMRGDENDENSTGPTSVRVGQGDFVQFLSQARPSE